MEISYDDQRWIEGLDYIRKSLESNLIGNWISGFKACRLLAR